MQTYDRLKGNANEVASFLSCLEEKKKSQHVSRVLYPLHQDLGFSLEELMDLENLGGLRRSKVTGVSKESFSGGRAGTWENTWATFSQAYK